MSNRRLLRRRPAAVTLLPGLLLLSMAGAGGYSTGVTSSSERIVNIVVTGATRPAADAPATVPAATNAAAAVAAPAPDPAPVSR